MFSFPILTAALILLELVALAMAWRAVKYSRTPQGSVGWVIFLIAAPFISVPAYLFFGHTKYNGYVNARQNSGSVVAGLEELKATHSSRVERQSHILALEHLAEVPIISGNGMQLLIDGQETFDAIFDAIDNAKKYVLIQYYTVRDDRLGNRLKEKLLAKASSGIKIRFLFDAVGCSKLTKSYIQELRDGGVEIHDVHAHRFPKNRFQVNLRNHRKTVIVDGLVAFTGGLNVADDYMGENTKFGPWRDTHLRLTGPVVSQLQLFFGEDWFWATDENLIDLLNWDSGRDEEDLDAVVMATGPGDDLETGSLYFCAMIHAAKQRLWIASPYFVPDVDVLSALKLAALRGVDVRVLVPDMVDHWTPWLAAFAYFDEVREVGIEIYRYQAGFMHQKVVLVDDDLASIGTLNLDVRSCRLNFETTLIFFEKSVAKVTAEMLLQDFSNSFLLKRDMKDQGLRIRIGAPIARLFSPIL